MSDQDTTPRQSAANRLATAEAWWHLLDPDDDLAPIAARSPAFAAALHDHRALQDDPATLAARAADPNTAVEVLLTLAGAFPAEFCRNPVFPLLLLENPNLPNEMDAATMGWLLAYADVPADFLAYVAAHGPPEAALTARLHIGSAGEAGPDWEEDLQAVRAGLSFEAEAGLLQELADLGAVPAWIEEQLPEGAAGTFATPKPPGAPPEDERMVHAADPTTPQPTLVLLADDEDPWVRWAVARNPAAPPELLAQMKEAEDWSDVDIAVYAAIAANPNTPPAVLERLAAQPSPLYTVVRRAVANNAGAPPRALELLAEEVYATDIRRSLVRHRNLPPALRAQILARALAACLATGQTLYRSIALAHPQTPPDDLERGAASPAWLERLAVARNPAAPRPALMRLAQDGNMFVRAAARREA